MTDQSQALNIREAAALLGVHEQTVRKLARSGKLPAFKVGRDWRFSRGALEQWTFQQSVSNGNGCSVLVVDDEEEVCRALAERVSRLGCRARFETSSASGLTAVTASRPDLILLDLMMPELNGVSFLKTLRQTEPDLPVVIVTGFPDSKLLHDAMGYAPVMLLAKPVAQPLLARTIRALGSDTALARAASD